MSNIVIQAENISKQYRLGTISTGALSDDLNRFWHKIRGKEDPYLKIGEANDRTSKGNSEYVWSLQDVNFEIEQGDAVGIIGRNGAGKSTLLKILSRVTQPTTGSIKTKGRIASLLEVGTGFHPELSGRENIFLNGAILGMRKHEIKRKFDAIVDFAGVERYIDTPVKRYSSGMYVRLAFAVAAYLESEILIIDEVLAVGDAEFQKKCLGKMSEVSKGEGRTVLFVSHNIASIKALCNKGILLHHGKLVSSGLIEDVVYDYQQSNILLDENIKTSIVFPYRESATAQIVKVSVLNDNGVECSEFDVFDEKFIQLTIKINEELTGFTPILRLIKDGVELFWSFFTDLNEQYLDSFPVGEYTWHIKLPNPLKKGRYSCTIDLGKLRVISYDVKEEVVSFYVDDFSFDPTNKSFAGARPGIIPAILDWKQR